MVAHKGQWLRVGTWALWPGPLSLNTTYNHTQAALCGAAFPLSPVLCVGVLEKMKSSCRWRFNCSAGQPLIIGKGNSEIRACPENSFSAGACWGSLQAKPTEWISRGHFGWDLFWKRQKGTALDLGFWFQVWRGWRF